MTNEPIFDVRKSVKRRNLERIAILPIVSAGFIALGFWTIPKESVWGLSLDAFATWGGWGFLGLFLIATGLINLCTVIVFIMRASSTTGEWHFRLTQDDLLWQVPDHAHGPEEGFYVQLSAIKSLEYRTVSRCDELDDRQYWVHFHDRASIQLRGHTGVSVSWLVSKIHQAGVPYEETHIDT